MSIEQDRESYFLQQLIQAPGRTLKKFAGTKANPKDLGLDAPAKKTVESNLLASNHISVEGKGANKQFRLTTNGAEYFKSLPTYPRPPEINPKLKAFMLLSFLAAGGGPMTTKQAKAMLPPAVAKMFGASKDALTSLFDLLVHERALEPSTTHGDTPDERYLLRLTDQGKHQLANLRQHVDVVVKLTGAAVNQLIDAAAGQAKFSQPATHAPAILPGHQAESLIALAGSGSFSDEELIRDARMLMTTRGVNGLLPIFELRRHVRKKFGDHAAGVEEFDRRLKRLRGDRLDLISLSDPSGVGGDQLREGIQGAGELFFYLRNPR